MISGLSLAWLQLTHQKYRLVITIVGVTFAVLLIFVELGLRDGLFEDSVTIHKTLQADLVVLSSETDTFWKSYTRPLPQSVLYNLRGIQGVKSVSPLYLTPGNFKNPVTFVKKTIAVCAFRPDWPAFNLPEINQQLAIISRSDTFLFDKLSRNEFGPIVAEFQKNGVVKTELSDRAIKVGGFFSVGGGVFSADGLLITSDLNYARIFKEPLEKVHLGLIKVDSNINLDWIKQEITDKLPKNLQVVTINKFMEIEKEYWAKSTPIGFIFNVLAVISLIFGGIIVYQIIYTQISDYLSVYATFKAIGYTTMYLITTVIQEAIIIAIMGYVPGLVISVKIYSFIQEATRLPIIMDLNRALIVLISTIIMCSVAGTLAVNKIRSADPADLF